MATPCTNRYEIIRRYTAWRILMKRRDPHGYLGVPPAEIYGIKGVQGGMTLDELVEWINNQR